MSARAILDVAMQNALGGQGGVQQLRVAALHDAVILAAHEEDWRAVTRDLLLDAEGVAHPLVESAVLAQQGPSRALMCTGLRHTHHRINGSDESWTSLLSFRENRGEA